MRDVDHQRPGTACHSPHIVHDVGVECALCHDPLEDRDEGFDFCQKCRSGVDE